MTRYRLGLAASTALLFLSPAFAMAAPDVVVSIKPIHSLVASIMKGVSEPSLIVEGAASPHTYTLKPSNARALVQHPRGRQGRRGRAVRWAQRPGPHHHGGPVREGEGQRRAVPGVQVVE